MKSTQSNIPRPLGERWRDIRLRYVPLIIYAAGVVMICYLWNTQWTPSTFTGEVQAMQANVASPLAGLLSDVPVRQFDPVTKGQILGKVTLSPAAERAGLAAIRADLQIMRARLTMDGQRIDQSQERLRVDLLDQKVELAISEAKLRFAENELARMRLLHTDKIVSQSEYELALGARDALLVDVKERTGLVADTTKALAELAATPAGSDRKVVSEAIDAAIASKEEEFRLLSESVLRAPISGVVTKLIRNNGENITAGEPLITISSDHGESIIGYVRQPISFDPKAGDVVMVRTRRGTKREAAEAQIVKVGGRLEFFAQSLRVRGFDSSQERGLPVLITIPQTLKLYPGELVDLALKN